MPLKKTKKFLVFCAFSAAFLGSVAADGSIDFSIQDDDRAIWINSEASGSERTFNADLKCEGDFSSPVISINSSNKQIKQKSGNKLSYSDFKSTGKYKAIGSCKDSNNKTKVEKEKFRVLKLVSEIKKPIFDQNAYRKKFLGSENLGDLYKGDAVEVDVEALGAPSDFSIDKSQIDFDVSLSDYDSKLSNNFEWKKDDSMAILRPYIPKDVSGGYRSVIVDTKFDTEDVDFYVRESTPDNAVYVTGIEVDKKKPGDRILRGSIGRIELDLSVESGYRKYISEERFKLEIDTTENSYGGKTESYDDLFKIVSNKDESGSYRLKLDTVPELPEDENFEVNVLFEDPEKKSDVGNPIEIASYQVTEDVIFNGYVRNSQNQPVSTNFRISDGSTYVEFSNLENGYYTKRIEPGNKTVEMEFKKGGEVKGSFSLEEVQMKKRYNSKVNFHYTSDPSGIGVPGADPVAMMSMVFGMPLKGNGSSASMKYDSAGINSEDTSVYECNNWDFKGRKCISSWKEIPDDKVTPNPIEYRLMFPIATLKTDYFDEKKEILKSAYVIATTSGLRLEGEPQVRGLDEGRIESEGQIEFQGTVIADKSKSIQDVEVNVSLLEDGSSVKTLNAETNENGVFKASGKAPEASGNYSVRISAHKKPFEGFKSKLKGQVWVYNKEAMRFSGVESQPEISLSERNSVSLELKNTGQTQISDIEISAEAAGIDSEYFSLSKSNIESLKPGNSEQVDLVFSFPEEYRTDDYYPEITIEAKGEGQRSSLESSLNINPILSRQNQEDEDSNKQQIKESENESSGVSLPSVPGANATGDFLASQSTVNLVLGLFMVLLMAVAGAVKKNKDKGSREIGSRIEGFGNTKNLGGVTDVEPLNSGEAVETQESEVSEEIGAEVEHEDLDDTTEDGQEDEDPVDEQEVEEIAEALREKEGNLMEDNDEEDDEETDEMTCDVCGDGFDTEAALKLHRKSAH